MTSMLFLVFLIVLCPNCCFCQPLSLLHRLVVLQKHFNMLRPWLACPNSLNHSMMGLVKSGLNEHLIGLSGNYSELLLKSYLGQLQEQDLLWCLEDHASSHVSKAPVMLKELLDSSSQNAVGRKWIVVASNATFNDLIENPGSIRVDQQVYFFNMDTDILIESYVIGGSVVQHNIGRIAVNGSEFVNLTSVPCFLDRRTNFYGTSLKTMASIQPPYFRFNTSQWYSKEGWITTGSGDQIKDITEDPGNKGLFYDVLKLLEYDMNFTSIVFIRRDGQWGHVVNGTWNGMISSVLKSEADFIMASLTYTLHRFTVIDYLYPIGKETPIMVIKRGGLEEYSWLTFWKPFRNDVWYMLLINTLFLLICVTLLKVHYAKVNCFHRSLIGLIEDVVKDFWMLGSSIFGRPPTYELNKRWKGLRILLLIVFTFSNLTFMSYKSSLTAELAVRRQDMPFNTLEHLLESEYRVLSLRGNRGALIDLFENPYEHSYMKKLYAKYVEPYRHQNEFSRLDDAIAHLMITHRRTLLMNAENLPKYRCKVITAWKTRYPRFLSYGFPKRSPYLKFVNHMLLKQIESGIMEILVGRHLKSGECENAGDREPKDVAIGMKKLISLFAWLGLAIVVVLYLFVWECMCGRVHRRMSLTEDDLPLRRVRDQRLSRLMDRWEVAERDEFEVEIDRICRSMAREIVEEMNKPEIKHDNY